MSSNNYQIYINQTLQLAETIVIKSSYNAEALNEWVAGALRGMGLDPTIYPDPTTWKYYLNLAGEYHTIDQVMTVVSVDTLEDIVFNKANLAIHLATARTYQYGTDAYTRLVQRYPNQEQLIIGILYPTDIHAAVKANDGQILMIPPGLVEEQETSFVPNLQNWIYHFKQRWHIQGFDYTEELYHATMLGIMYLLLVQAMLTYRLMACNTNEAHSFHIKEYLASHNHLDVYYESMTLKQALYFYRNVAYIERHAGSNNMFDTLLEHIMTERFIPMAEYSMKHDVSQQAQNIYPQVIFKKRQLNLDIALPEDDQITIKQMLIKEEPIAPGNLVDLDEIEQDVKALMENSPSNVVATKVIESTLVDETNSSPWILSEILYNHWLFFSSKGLYNAYVNILNVTTGETIPLTAKEAFILAIYALSKSVGETLDEVPLAYASRVQRIPTPSVNDIYSIVDHAILDRSVAVQALSMQPIVRPMVSIDSFYNTASAINDAVQMQRRLIAWQEHYEGRAMVQAMVTRIYQDCAIRLEPAGTKYDNWLTSRNIDLSTLTREEFGALFNNIITQATGADLHPELSIAKLQHDMIGIFTRLSSYGIQVLAEINDESIRKTDWPAIRVGTVTGKLESNPQNPDATVSVDRVSGSCSFSVVVDLNHPAVGPDVHQFGTHRVEVDLSMNKELLSEPTTYYSSLPLATIGITSPDPEGVVIPRGWVSFIGIEYFLNLTPEQIGTITDPYNPPGTFNPPGKTPIDQVVPISELDGLRIEDSDRTEPLSNSITDVNLGRTYPE